MKLSYFSLFIICLFICGSNSYSQNVFAVPGALGFGKYVRGAYAGSNTPTILIVDTLAEESILTGENRGSFRWALEQDFPRIVLFEVSGYINLKSYLRVYNPYLSVYGQTAPGKGITITGSYVELRTDFVILQHLRFRLNSSSTAQEDALTIYQGSNVFIDHCSFSFALDENIGVVGTFKGPLTISNCILSHPIYAEDSKGILMDGVLDSISLIGNAFIHCGQRSPYIQGTYYTTVEILNNLCYNAEYYGIMLNNGNSPKFNIIGNVWKPGNNSVNPQNRGAVRIREGMNLGAKFYIKDNLCPGKINGAEWNTTVKIDNPNVDSTTFYQKEPYDYTSLNNIYPASELIPRLDSFSGAFYWNRDPVDSIAIYDMVNNSGHWLTDTTETFYPQIPELSTKLDLPELPHLDQDKNGFTNLEEWVNDLARGADTNGSETVNIEYRQKNEGFKIYPNPSKNNLVIELIGVMSNQDFDKDISISNSIGKLVFHSSVTNTKQIINISSLPKGFYFVTVGNITQKIIKK